MHPCSSLVKKKKKNLIQDSFAEIVGICLEAFLTTKCIKMSNALLIHYNIPLLGN